MKKKLVFIITSLIILFLASVKILISLELIDKDIFISSNSNAKKYFEAEVVKTYNIGPNDSDSVRAILYNDGTLKITGTGEMRGWAEGDDVPWYGDKESITEVIIDNGVTNIADEAFAGYSNLTKITIPGTVEIIGKTAFVRMYWINSNNNSRRCNNNR